MNEYPNGKGWWTEHKGFRVEVFRDGTWAVVGHRMVRTSWRNWPRHVSAEEAKEQAREALRELLKNVK